MQRQMIFNIFRYNPGDPDSAPHMETFVLDEAQSMTLFIALTRIREEQDPSLQFDFVCRAGICGSCGILVNGRPRLACQTLVRDLPDQNTLLPMPVFKLIGDLSVDTGTWFRSMQKRVESWIHTDKAFDPSSPEEPMSNEKAEEIYEIERCIECGCCVAGCGKANMSPDFLGPVAFNRIARFIADPRDMRTSTDYYEIVGTDEGIFGCLGLLACEDVCPKNILLQDQLGALRAQMGWTVFKRFFGKLLQIGER